MPVGQILAESFRYSMNKNQEGTEKMIRRWAAVFAHRPKSGSKFFRRGE